MKNKSGKKITNHCYLIHGEYPETNFLIQTPVLIKKEYKIKNFFIHGTGFFIPFFITLFLTDGEPGGSAPFHHYVTLYESSPFLVYTMAIIIGYIGWSILGYYLNKNRVKLENMAFEKIFDVYCQDPVLSRMIITPAFMDRLVEFVQKNRGNYEFLFYDKSCYIKKILPKSTSYLEINIFRNLQKNAHMYLKWYVDLKEIIALVSDTGVLVFGKNISNI